jgi:hypothetical protein
VDVLIGEESVEQFARYPSLSIVRSRLGKDGADDRDTVMRSRIHMRNRGAAAFRLLDKEHSTIARGARHQVVGSLVDKVPAQVRQAHDIGGHFHWVSFSP